MGKMRNGLDTWLKQECADVADNLAVASSLVQRAAISAWNRENTIAGKAINNADLYLAGLNIPDDQLTELREAARLLDDSDTVDGTRYNEIVTKLEIGGSKLHRLSFEKVVECQCGKPTTSTMHGIVVDEERAKSGTCYCQPETERCWSPGIIGALNDEQKQQFCETGGAVAMMPESVMYAATTKGSSSKRETPVAVGDKVYDIFYKAEGKVVGITSGKANYGTLIVADMDEDVYYTPPGAGEEYKTLVSGKGIHFFTVGDWRRRFIRR